MTRRGVLALAFVLAAPAAGAVSLGEIEVRSYLGDKLDARVAVSPGAGESIRGACFSLARDGAPGVPRLSDADLQLQRSASGTYLRIRSLTPIEDPAFGLGIAIACPGQAPQATKEFSVLVDPRSRTRAPSLEASRAPPAASTQLGAREGDTLESIAHAIFPRDRAARTSYLAALRQTNPTLAARGDREPIPPKEAVALPDLRTFMQRRNPRTAPATAPGVMPSAASELAAAAPAATPDAAPRASRTPPARRVPQPTLAAPPDALKIEPAVPRKTTAERPAGALPVAPPPRARVSPGFQLKLSGSEVDLTRSSKIDDRSRAQLRERMLMLDADDQVAAMLSMRNSLKQLEARVAELQLKLAGMPPSLEGKSAPSSAAPKAQPPQAAIAPVPRVEPVPAKVEPPAPKIETPAPKVELPAPKAEPTPAPTSAATPEPITPPTVDNPPQATAATPSTPPPVTAEARAPRVIPYPMPVKPSALPEWLWAVVALLVVLALLVAWFFLRRRRASESELYDEDEFIAPPHEPLDEIAPESAPIYADEPEPVFAPAPQERGVVSSDADLATRIPEENSADLRRRYIEERFPEMVSRMIVLEDPDSVVKGARLFYEDGALTRAVELLQFAIEAHPEQLKTWLALFEIFRLERLTGEFAALALRFKQQHGETDNWRKVQYFGREIDPGNALYQEEPLNTLETIGPREARRLAAAASFDPVAENWLNAPMDFENEVLANELRMVLMQQAGLTEQDLVPNAMPALRNVEMFNVA